jgi:phage terminase large subunit GpA-like protein
MDSVNEPNVEVVVIMSSAQVGKTEIINNIIGYHVDYEPCPMLCLQPTLDMGQTWSKDRLAPMIRDTPALRFKIKSVRSRDSGNTLLHKPFAGGHITIAGANSPASLASRPVRLLLCDEVDRYPASAGTEGDPISLGKKRTTTFWNRKIIITSTPTVKGASRVDREYELSDQRRFFVPCPHCDEMQLLSWDRIVFDKKDVEGSTILSCVNGCVIEEKDKQKMLEGGEWIPQMPFNGRAGFHLNELYSPWKKWWEVAKDFLEMKDDPETLKTWVNTSLGECWEEKGDAISDEGLLQRRESYDHEALPDDILFITCSVDTQKDRLEALTQGWGDKFEHWDVEHKVFYGDPNQPRVWQDLDDWLLTPYKVDGVNLKIAITVVDSGGHHADQVYNFCKPREGRRVFAIKGSSKYYAPIASRPTLNGSQKVKVFSVGTDTAKDTIVLGWLNNIDSEEEDRLGRLHFPHTHDEEFFKQLTSEKRVTKNFRGTKKLAWKKVRDRNEALDLHVYNYAAYMILAPNIKVILKKRELRNAPAKPQEKPRQATQRPRTISRRSKNWATDL